MASPLAMNPVQAPEAASEAPRVAASQRRPQSSSSKTLHGQSSFGMPPSLPNSGDKAPQSHVRGRSRNRLSSASTRFPVNVDSAVLGRRVNSPDFSDVFRPTERGVADMSPVIEVKQAEPRAVQSAVPLGLENFDIGEASDDEDQEPNLPKVQMKKGESSKSRKNLFKKVQRKLKEKTSESEGQGSSDKGKEREGTRKGKEKETWNGAGKMSSDPLSKGEEALRDLLGPVRNKFGPLLYPRSATPQPAASADQRQRQQDPSHRALRLGKPLEEFSSVDLEAQATRRRRGMWSLWQVAMAATMTLNTITFILVVTTLWTINHKIRVVQDSE